MITPRFSLNQDEKTLTVQIRAPYCSLRELDVEVIDSLFIFTCKPYYLRLSLPGKLVEDNCKSFFDADIGEFKFCYQKAIPGEYFEDLEYITKFLVTKVDASYEGNQDRITIINSDLTTEDEKLIDESLQAGFGFALQGHKNFMSISSEFSDVFEIDPGEVTLPERRKLRLQYEQGKFDMEHYLCDLVDEDGQIAELLGHKTPWDDLVSTDTVFSASDLDFLKDLQNKEYNLTSLQTKYAFNGLLDILFAYCYDGRSVSYDRNCESGWTIVKLAATLCWLDAFETPKDMFISASRRSMIYPLYRNYKLVVKVLEDLKSLLKLGEKYIIKCLIEIHKIFVGGDCCRYILNNLFIKDYITFIMKCDKMQWEKFLDEVYSLSIDKQDLGLNLDQVEQCYSLEKKMADLAVDDSDDSSTDSDETSDASSSSTDCDSDSSRLI